MHHTCHRVGATYALQIVNTTPSEATFEASCHALFVGATCAHGGAMTEIWWTFFFSSLFFLSFPRWNIKVSFHLFFVSNLVLIFFISICSVFLFLFFSSISSHHLISFNLYIKFSHSFYCYFVFFFPSPNWVLFSMLSISIWFQFFYISNLIPIILLLFLLYILDLLYCILFQFHLFLFHRFRIFLHYF